MNFKYLIFIGFLANFYSAYSFAQSSRLYGTIIDAKTREPLIGVSVIIDGGKLGTVTDFDGKYEIALNPGNYSVTYSYVSYVKVDINLVMPATGELKQDVELVEQQMELKMIVISASKYEKDVRDETVSMEVVPKTFINNNNPTGTDQVMNRVPGVNVIDGQANIRAGSGFTYGAGSRVAVLVDGLPLVTADAGDTKWSFMAIENIEQIEVIKGAASALYGSSAMNGVINVRTAYPTSKPETKINTFFNVYTLPKNRAMGWWDNKAEIPFESGFGFSHKQKLGQLDLVLGGNSFKSSSYRQANNEVRGRFNIGTRYRFKKLDGLAIGVNSNYQSGISGTFFIWADDKAGAYQPSALGGSTNVNKGIRFTIDPFIEYSLKKGDKLSLKTRYFKTINDNNSNQGSNADLYYAEASYFHEIKSIAVSLVAGAMGSISKVKSDLYSDHDGYNSGVYVQTDKKFTNLKMNISLGLRYEIFAIDTALGYFNRPLTRFGVSKTLGKATFLRASYGEGYRFPSIAEKFIRTNVGFDILPNPVLQPEKGWNAEIGVKQGMKFGNLENLLDLAFYWQEYNNMMEFNFVVSPTAIGFQSQNIGNTRVAGIELSTIGQGKVGPVTIQYLGGINYALPFNKYRFVGEDTINIGVGDYLGAFFRNIFKTDTADLKNILYFRNLRTCKFDINTSYNKFTLGIGYNYFSLMDRINAELLFVVKRVSNYIKEHAHGDHTWEMRLAYQVNDNLSIGAICKNIENRFYYIRPALAEGPRNFTITANYKFN